MAETYYAWNPVFDCITKETDAAGATIAEYTHEPKLYGGLISQHRSGDSSFYHYDAIGTTRALTDSSQAVTDTAVYTAFGEKTASVGPTVNPFGFVGAVGYHSSPAVDEIYVRARDYGKSIGCWLSIDPIDTNNSTLLAYQDHSDRHEKARYMQPYRYADNVPTVSADPSGELTITPVKPIRLSPKCGPAAVDKASGDCTGGLCAHIKWRFSVKPWPCRSLNGVFVQEVNVHCMVCPCPSSAACRKRSFQYWESWPVTRDARGARHIVQVNDKAQFSAANPTLGQYRQSGKVRFYCIQPVGMPIEAGEIPLSEITWEPSGVIAEFPGDPCATTTGILPRTTREPVFWQRRPKEGDFGGKPVGRFFSMNWDCCCSNRDMRFARANGRPR